MFFHTFGWTDLETKSSSNFMIYLFEAFGLTEDLLKGISVAELPFSQKQKLKFYAGKIASI